ncbi:MAG: glutamate 5-kinase, partial [Rickettsiales bacterium]|nr:glutamate 5-kinase [Rickettsiales bacterium]
QDVAELRKEGKHVIIVTSGAIALGRTQLGLKPGAKLLLEEKQAAAAIGQIELFSAWAHALAPHGLKAGQLLLTAEDSIDRRRYLNARNTLSTLLELGAVPIINENDTVATTEIRFGDNDRLSARITQIAGADLLILLSDIDGLYTANPATDKTARFIPEVTDITPEIESMAGGSASAVGTGGMVTKLAAAKIALSAGCHMLIARGNMQHPLRALAEGARHTRFIAGESPLSARKHWIAGSIHTAGSITVDDGAATALKNGKSLLPAGVTAAEGQFGQGDAVLIKSAAGSTIGKGLIAYSAEDTIRIMGKKSHDIETILGFKRRDVLIHRDDMTLE